MLLLQLHMFHHLLMLLVFHLLLLLLSKVIIFFATFFYNIQFIFNLIYCSVFCTNVTSVISSGNSTFSLVVFALNCLSFILTCVVIDVELASTILLVFSLFTLAIYIPSSCFCTSLLSTLIVNVNLLNLLLCQLVLMLIYIPFEYNHLLYYLVY